MAFNQTDVEKLEKAIASGRKVVWFADRRVEYQDLNAMRDALKQMRDEVAGAAGVPKRRRTVRAYQGGSGY